MKLKDIRTVFRRRQTDTTAHELEDASEQRSPEFQNGSETEFLFKAEESSASEPAEKILANARSAQDSKNWEEAIRIWNEICTRFPHELAGPVGLAETLSHMQRQDEADEVLLAAQQHFPDEAVPYVNQAWLVFNRGDYARAQKLWKVVRQKFPSHWCGYAGGAAAYREAGHIEEAREILLEGQQALPDDFGIAIEFARIAHHIGDWLEAVDLWQRLINRASDNPGLYMGLALSYRVSKRFIEAENVLSDAVSRFPNNIHIGIDFAKVAQESGDLPKAEHRWRQVLAMSPNHLAAYLGLVNTLTRMSRSEEAEDLIEEASKLYPDEASLLIDHGWIAQRRENWVEALIRFERVREKFPDHWVGYVGSLDALRRLRRFDEAAALTEIAVARLPEDPEIGAQNAWLAFDQNQWDVALERFSLYRERFPDRWLGYSGAAQVLRALQRFEEADAVLENGIRRLPHEFILGKDYVELATAADRDDLRLWDEAIRRARVLIASFPHIPDSYTLEVSLLSKAGRLDEADETSSAALQKFPQNLDLTSSWAEIAKNRGDVEEAIRRYERLLQQFPDSMQGYQGLADALLRADRHSDAARILDDAEAKFPSDDLDFMRSRATIAGLQGNWRKAMEYWEEAFRKFPDRDEIRRSLFETKLRLLETDNDESPQTFSQAPEQSSSDSIGSSDGNQLVMHFESLGGDDVGCEFGLFQRYYKAEPLGLLRWAGMRPDQLRDALESTFDGVGSPEQTELQIPNKNEHPEYMSIDKRFGMRTHTFVNYGDMPEDKMFKNTCRRMQYLRRKLIDDLETGEKIFVYRITDRNLTQKEIDQLHKAMRRYGNNTLLYVRYAEEDKPDGTVDLIKPGLMIGYMKQFSMSPFPMVQSWTAICTRAYELTRVEKALRPIGLKENASITLFG